MKKELVNTIIDALTNNALIDVITISTCDNNADARLVEESLLDYLAIGEDWEVKKINFRFAHNDNVSKAQRISVFSSKLEINDVFNAYYERVGKNNKKSNYFIDSKLVTDRMILKAIDNITSAQLMLIFKNSQKSMQNKESIFKTCDFSALAKEYTKTYGSCYIATAKKKTRASKKAQ